MPLTCAQHGVTEPIACGRCGDFTCAQCAAPYRDERLCKACIEPAVLEREPAWESLHKFGTFRAYAKTARAVLFDPAAFFKKNPWAAGSGKPVGFYAFASTIFGWPLGVLGLGALLAIAIGSGWIPPGELAVLVFDAVIYYPVAPLVVILAAGTWYHVLAKVFGGAGTFDVTMRVLGYSWGSLWVFALLPGLGIVPALVWGLVVPFYGLREGHALSTAGALVVAASPVVAAAGVAALLFA